MENFFKKHPDTILVTIVIIFLGIIIWYFSWGFAELGQEVSQVVTLSPNTAATVSFDLKDAAQLNLRGLMQ